MVKDEKFRFRNKNSYEPLLPRMMGIETMTIPVPDQTYFIKNCSSMMYHSL
jgi:hypothetical protein